MILRDEKWGEIPLLHVVSEEFVNKEIPVVVFHHGFMSAKEHNLHFAINLASKGIRVLLPDAYLHGAREENLDIVQLGLRFWEVVLTSIEELGMIREELFKRKLLTTKKIGVSGTSLGGITSLGMLATYDWIDAAAIMMGAPGFVELAKNQISSFEKDGFEVPHTEKEKSLLFDDLSMLDLTIYPTLLDKRPIHFWHGKKDVVVPFGPTYKFYESIKADYSDVPDRLSFTVDKEAGHVVSRLAMLEATKKLASYLNE